MSRWGRVAVLLVAGSLLAGCAREGTDETDRQAETLANAISYPRQYSAEGFARAALATPLGQSEGFTLLEATDFDAAETGDRLARLVIRIHKPGTDSGWNATEPVTVCYGMDFSYYGIIGAPAEVDCPADAHAITYSPAPAWAEKAEYEKALKSLLRGLPGSLSEDQVRNRLYGAYLLEPAELVDDHSSLDPQDPRPFVEVRGADLALAIQAGKECLLAKRVRGEVTVRRPPPPVGRCAPSFE